jgi:hypothetical protein
MAGNRVCRLMFSIVHELLHNLMEITSRMVSITQSSFIAGYTTPFANATRARRVRE